MGACDCPAFSHSLRSRWRQFSGPVLILWSSRSGCWASRCSWTHLGSEAAVERQVSPSCLLKLQAGDQQSPTGPLPEVPCPANAQPCWLGLTEQPELSAPECNPWLKRLCPGTSTWQRSRHGRRQRGMGSQKAFCFSRRNCRGRPEVVMQSFRGVGWIYDSPSPW